MLHLTTLCVKCIVQNAAHDGLSQRVKAAPSFYKRFILDEAAKYNFLNPSVVRSLLDGASQTKENFSARHQLDLSAVSLTDAVVTSFAATRCGGGVARLDLSRTPASVRVWAWRRLAEALEESLTVLDLSHSASKGLMGSFASRCASLRVVRAEGALQVTDADVVLILSRCEALQELSLRRCSQLTNKCLVRGLPERSYLLHLDLRECRQMTDAALEAIAERCPTLMRLSLEGQKLLQSGLTRVLDSCRALEQLDVPLCSIDEAQLLRIRNTDCRVRHLDLFGAYFSEATLLFLFGNVFRQLHSLSLAGVRHLTLDVFRYVCLRSPQLRALSLKGHLAAVTDAFVHDIATRLPCLERLDLGLCRAITAPALKALFGSLPTALAEINLVCMPVVNDAVVLEIADRHGPRLEKLILGGCPLISDVSLAALAQQCIRLRSLCLKGTGVLSSPVLGRLVRANPNLRMLSLSGCKAVDDSLLEALSSSCQQLSALHLSGVKLSAPRLDGFRSANPRCTVYGKRQRHPL